MAFTQEIADSGELLAGDALAGPRDRDHRAGPRTASATITDGPFAETKEHLGGYYSSTSRTSTGPSSWRPGSPTPAPGASRSPDHGDAGPGLTPPGGDAPPDAV